MAVRSLPVINSEPPRRPQIVSDCQNGAGIRPCPWISCRFSLLADVLEDGSLVVNAPSSRLHGAERAIPNKRESERQWFVEVRLPVLDSDKVNAAVQERTAARETEARGRADARSAKIIGVGRRRGARIVDAARARCHGLKAARTPATKRRRKARAAEIVRKARERASVILEAAKTRAAAEVDRIMAAARDDRGPCRIYSLGPLDSAARAGEISAAWEAEHGAGTAHVHRDLPSHYQRTGAQDRDIDAKFLDEAEDAVDYWFDEPKPDLPSCLLDEIAKLDRSSEDCLLDGIAKLMYVSRERIRQVEEIALNKVKAAGVMLGLEMEAEHG